MKTIDNIQETGNRNITNFNMKTLVVFTSVAIFSFIIPANAGNSGVPGNIYPSNTATATDAANLSVSLMETDSEETLEVESWMFNENLFDPLSVSESEEPMAVEEWMINAENFMQSAFTEESDPVLEVEDWMLNENTWGK
ncbi:MAG: hypothetical protein ACM3PR_01595 [Bacteroidales bacterium]